MHIAMTEATCGEHVRRSCGWKLFLLLPQHVPPDQFELDEEKFLQNLRSAHRGVAGGPSGMTSEHLRILLENVRDGHLFFLMGQQLAQAVAPKAATQAMRLGWWNSWHRCKRRRATVGVQDDHSTA